MIIVKIIGGLGNQLFQYSTGRALALKFNAKLKLDLSFFDEPKYQPSLRLTKFNLPFERADEEDWRYLINAPENKLINLLSRFGVKFSPYHRKTHLIESHVLKIVYQQSQSINRNYYIEGWLGNENYFIEYRNVLLRDLDLDHMLSQTNKELQHRIRTTNSVAVHIRRGDYLTNSYFNYLNQEYYQSCIDYISKHIQCPVFYFFSDDIQWVKNEFCKVPGAVFVDGNSDQDSAYSTSGDISDLMLMRSCKHNIIANSTFSWWGAWLNTNPNKIVIAPKRWYNNLSAQENYECGELVPRTWIKL